MKGAEGPGRGRPRGCGGRELAPDRRRPAGEKARPWGVPRSRPSGVAPSPGVHFGPPPLAAASLGVPRPFSASLPPRPPARGRVLGTPILLQSAFEAPRPARGQEISHLDGGGVGRGPQLEFGRIVSWDTPTPPRCSAAGLSRTPEGYRRTGAPPAVGPRPGELRVSPSAWRGSPRGRGPHKALLWLGAERHRVPFVPPVTPWRARLMAGPGPGAGYVPGGSARGSRTAPGSGRAIVCTGPARVPAIAGPGPLVPIPRKSRGRNLFAFPTPQRALGRQKLTSAARPDSRSPGRNVQTGTTGCPW